MSLFSSNMKVIDVLSEGKVVPIEPAKDVQALEALIEKRKIAAPEEALGLDSASDWLKL